MKNLTDNELKNVDGGGFNVGLLVGIGAAVTFIIGIIDGIVRPLRCN